MKNHYIAPAIRTLHIAPSHIICASDPTLKLRDGDRGDEADSHKFEGGMLLPDNEE